MIVQEFSNHQHVIPRWLGYLRSIELNELGTLLPEKQSAQTHELFQNEINEFHTSKSHRHAADLFERLILANKDDLARQIAPSIAAEKRLASPIRNIAKEILEGPAAQPSESTNDELIRIHKHFLREQPRNGIRWVELARLYTIKRQYEKAYDALRVGFDLNPRDRYTARSFIRFLLHINETRKASNVLGTNINSIHDPWLKGVALSALMIAGRSPNSKISGEPKSILQEKLFEHSEFLAACGMLLIESGKDKGAKAYFRTAWNDPSCNVTTHAEWLTRTLLPELRSDALSLKRKTSEAIAGEAYSRGDWPSMADSVQEWILEEPYSSKPFKFLVQVSNVRGEFDYTLKWIEKVESFGRCDFGTKISKLYALLSLKQLSEAEKLLSEFDVESLENSQKVLVLANLGLYFIQNNSADEGLALYKRAEREAAVFSLELAAKVFINAAAATRLAGKSLTEADMKRLRELSIAFKHEIAVAMLMKRIDPTLYLFEPPKPALPKANRKTSGLEVRALDA